MVKIFIDSEDWVKELCRYRSKSQGHYRHHSCPGLPWLAHRACGRDGGRARASAQSTKTGVLLSCLPAPLHSLHSARPRQLLPRFPLTSQARGPAAFSTWKHRHKVKLTPAKGTSRSLPTSRPGQRVNSDAKESWDAWRCVHTSRAVFSVAVVRC